MGMFERCECGKCGTMIRVCTEESDKDIFGNTPLKKNQIELTLSNDKGAMTVLIDKNKLIKTLDYYSEEK